VSAAGRGAVLVREATAASERGVAAPPSPKGARPGGQSAPPTPEEWAALARQADEFEARARGRWVPLPPRLWRPVFEYHRAQEAAGRRGVRGGEGKREAASPGWARLRADYAAKKRANPGLSDTWVADLLGTTVRRLRRAGVPSKRRPR
jgi:hypothetical protein